MEDLDIIEERDGYRVRLQRDESPEQPYDDGATPIFAVEHSRWGGFRQAEAFNKQAEPYLDAVTEILHRHDLETLERFVKIFYGAARMDSWYSEGLEGHYVAFDTAAWREKVGAPEESLKEEYYLSEVRAWAEGDVWGYIVEKEVDYTKTYKEDPDFLEEDTEWIEVDDGSCWGLYSRDYAEQAAKTALDEALTYEGVSGHYAAELAPETPTRPTLKEEAERLLSYWERHGEDPETVAKWAITDMIGILRYILED